MTRFIPSIIASKQASCRFWIRIPERIILGNIKGIIKIAKKLVLERKYPCIDAINTIKDEAKIIRSKAVNNKKTNCSSGRLKKTPNNGVIKVKQKNVTMLIIKNLDKTIF